MNAPPIIPFSSLWLLALMLFAPPVLIDRRRLAEAKKPDVQPDWAKKDLRDFSDADIERLYEQWEEDEEPLPVDELPEWDPRKPQTPIDFNSINMENPENLLKATKKGKTVMMFVRVSGQPGKDKTEEITSIWQTGLWNNHMQAERFQLEDDRALFMFKDGSMAWEAKDFFVQQEGCEDVTLEQKTYCGKFAVSCKEENSGQRQKKAKKKKKRKDEL